MKLHSQWEKLPKLTHGLWNWYKCAPKLWLDTKHERIANQPLSVIKKNDCSYKAKQTSSCLFKYLSFLGGKCAFVKLVYVMWGLCCVSQETFELHSFRQQSRQAGSTERRGREGRFNDLFPFLNSFKVKFFACTSRQSTLNKTCKISFLHTRCDQGILLLVARKVFLYTLEIIWTKIWSMCVLLNVRVHYYSPKESSIGKYRWLSSYCVFFAGSVKYLCEMSH